MTLYKYVHEARVDVLEKLRIRFTQARALNDPFDVNPCLTDFVQGSIDFALERSRGETPTEAQLRESALKITEDFKRQLDIDYLILSLSKRNDKMLMWAHYANCHRGLVFGMDEHHRFFRGTGITTGLMPVEYSETRFKMPRAEDWKEGDLILPAVLRKSRDWEYEEEVRVFARTVAACERIEIPRSGPVYLLPFQKELLTEVIFGIYSSEDVKVKVRDLIARNCPHVRLFQAKLNDTSFDLDIEPLAT